LTESGANEDPASELGVLARALLAHAEWLAASGAVGLPAAPVAAADPAADPRASSPRGFVGPARDTASRPPLPASRSANATARPVSTAAGPSQAAAAEPPAPAPREPPKDLEARERRLAVLAGEVEACKKCGLHATRTQTVFARGTGSSGLCFVGEGPGADEDAQGFPFVGKAGQLLDRMIAAMGFGRDEVYVANILKCRPPNNRKPELDEMAACVPYLAEQLELIEPQVIVALGATAVQGLLGTTEGITRLRGRWRLYKGRIAVMPTFHPAFLLRNPAAKRDVWEDLQAVLRQMGRPVPARGA